MKETALILLRDGPGSPICVPGLQPENLPSDYLQLLTQCGVAPAYISSQGAVSDFLQHFVQPAMVHQQFLISYQSHQVALLTAALLNNYSWFVAHQQWTRDLFSSISNNQRDNAALHSHMLRHVGLLALISTYICKGLVALL